MQRFRFDLNSFSKYFLLCGVFVKWGEKNHSLCAVSKKILSELYDLSFSVRVYSK